MRVAILGASGLVGKYLVREWGADEVVSLTSRDVDIRDRTRVRQVLDGSRPDWIVLAAAYTDVDGCETNAQLAYEVNCMGAANVAEAALHCGAKLLFISTDYVFDGEKYTPYETTDRRNPKSVYGRTKAEAEVRISEVLPHACIMRTSWVFGTRGRCFPETILKLAASRSELDVVNDQRGCPTYARDLSRAIVQLCRANAGGIVHVTNTGDCTWYDFALEIVQQAGLATLVRPTTTEKFPRPAPRPKYSVLSAASLAPYQIPMPSWRSALGDYLTERRNLP
jgi:dTDP-4-dehydrorhamnose reductase